MGRYWVPVFFGLCAVLVSSAPLSAKPSHHGKPLTPSEVFQKATPSIVAIDCNGPAATKIGGATGFIVSENGRIVTNVHVIEPCTSLTVRLSNSDAYDATYVLETDQRRDIAVIRIKAVGLPALPLGDSNDLKVGEPVYSIGNPSGLQNTLQEGIVSGFREMPGFRVVQVSAHLNPGNSGGPILNSHGEVVAVAAAKVDNAESLGFAIPVNYVKGLIDGSTEVAFPTFAAALKQGSATQARDLLVRSDEILTTAQSIDLRGTFAAGADGRGVQVKLDIPYSLIASGKKFRYELGGVLDRLTISDGSSSWTYTAMTKTYTITPSNPAVVDPLQAILYGRQAANIQSASFQPDEVIDVQGHPIACRVVKAQYAVIPGVANTRGAVRTVWLDRERNLVIRDLWEATMSLANGTTTRFIMLVNFTQIAWDKPVNDDLFVFHPPEGSKQAPTAAKLTMEPSIVAPPDVRLPNYGDPLSKLSSLPASNGTGVAAPGNVYRVGSGVTPPSILQKREPEYTKQARNAKIEGVVLLYIQVDPAGRARNIRVVKSLDPGLDRKAIEAVRSWLFRPGTKDGKPVTVEATIEVNFKLL